MKFAVGDVVKIIISPDRGIDIDQRPYLGQQGIITGISHKSVWNVKLPDGQILGFHYSKLQPRIGLRFKINFDEK